ncbi:putative tRNA/rRNA methyltransferase slr1673 [Planktothrix tepida]|uniref:tRNA/rRNA methyltransferase slr1673 n=2 Tax=Planktothrix TaxID=54304 RepID=A0A9W4G398_9CYAN|nr:MULTISPECIES: RNA methyltransferase [Planktothrix]CAD5931896.1 putative tRNA/rRNA methyltransferase slr1673 [Planktothrix pseudagardhii]CAD5977527.1 putative tRNA/rRNA methyltransferase slr1673 [Planktothrix tepida]CUR35995.1 putative enzyme [Planktothrix tepida PCC 9214]
MLTSLQNPLVKQIRKLHQAKGRKEQQLFLLEGTHLVEEASAAGYPLTTICYTSLWQDRHQPLWDSLRQQTPRFELVSPEVLEAMATTVHPDGVIALAPRLELKPQALEGLGIALETLQDPGNLGTIIRTATATGVDGLWLSADSVDLDHPKVLRASAGAWFRLNKTVSPNLADDIIRFQQQGLQIVATVPQASLSYWQLDFTQPTLMVFGNEGGGLSPELQALADHQVQIPLQRGVESLNVGICAALMLYEAQRQRTGV